jgi:hypothetical protein
MEALALNNKTSLVGAVLGVLVLFGMWLIGASFALLYFGVAIYILLALMMPGYVLGSFLFRDSSCTFRIAASVAITSPIYSVAILLAVAAGQYRDTLSSLFALAMLCGSLIVLYRRPELVRGFRTADKTHLKWMILLFIFTISLMALPISFQDVPFLIPYSHGLQETRLPILPGDQYLPYRLEQILLNGADWKGVNFYGIWTVADRTPLMGLVAAFVSSSLHVIPPLDWVWNVPSAAFSWSMFQVVGCFLDAQILLPAYLVSKRIFGTSKALLTMPFLAMSPFIIWNTFYTSPKSMAAYFLLLSLLLIIEKKTIRAGVIAALGFLSHSYALFYIAGFFYLVCQKAKARFPAAIRSGALFLIPAAVTVAPWFAWSALVYGHVSSFVVYPFASSGSASTLGLAQVMEEFVKAPISLFIWVRVVNTFRTLLPWPLIITPGWFNQFGWADIFSWTNSIDALLLVAYIFTIPGALSLSLTLPAYVAWLRSRSRVFLASVTIPLILSILFFGYPNPGLAGFMAQPLVPLLVAAAVTQVRKRIASVLLVTAAGEYLFFIWGNVYPARLLLTNLRTVADGFIFGMIVACALASAMMTLEAFRFKPATESEMSTASCMK